MLNERVLSKFNLVAAQFPLSNLLYAEVPGPIFTKILHNVEALVALLNHTYAKRCFKTTREQKVNAVNFYIYKKLPKLTGYHSNLGLQQNLCEFYNPIHMFTNAEKPVETGVVVAEISSGKC